jgi:uncharacterized protein YjbI with pentapeptide repeats
MALVLAFLLSVSLIIFNGQSYNPERDKDCPGCDLAGANLSEADLTAANLFGADLNGVHGADFTGALNVPAKYLKD